MCSDFYLFDIFIYIVLVFIFVHTTSRMPYFAHERVEKIP